MADREIADLTAATTPLAGTEEIHIDQGGNSRRVAVSEIAGLVNGAMLKSTYDPNDDGIIAVAQGGTNASTASGARTNLGLGTMAVQAASSVNITGGTVTGITDLAIADGGTGASTAEAARENLGLEIGVDVQEFLGDGTTGQVLKWGASAPEWGTVAGSGDMLGANNLSEITSTSTARSNLGLGSAAVADTSDFATAAQGLLADSALQSGSGAKFYVEQYASLTDATSAAASAGGGVVVLERGVEYSLSAQLALGNGVRIDGNGATLSLDASIGVQFIRWADNSDNIGIWDCVIKVNENQSVNNLAAVFCSGGRDVRISGNTITGHDQGIEVRSSTTQGAKRVRIYDNTLTDYVENGNFGILVAWGTAGVNLNERVTDVVVTGNIIVGPKLPQADSGGGTADTIALQGVDGFICGWNQSSGGGENAITLARCTRNGILIGNVAKDTDRHAYNFGAGFMGLLLDDVTGLLGYHLVGGSLALRQLLTGDVSGASSEIGQVSTDPLYKAVYLATNPGGTFIPGEAVTINPRYTITGATKANPVVITIADGHSIANGSTITIFGVGGMTELNDRTFTTANATATTLELVGENGTGHSTYTSGGSVKDDSTVVLATTIDDLIPATDNISCVGNIGVDNNIYTVGNTGANIYLQQSRNITIANNAFVGGVNGLYISSCYDGIRFDDSNAFTGYSNKRLVLSPVGADYRRDGFREWKISHIIGSIPPQSRLRFVVKQLTGFLDKGETRVVINNLGGLTCESAEGTGDGECTIWLRNNTNAAIDPTTGVVLIRNGENIVDDLSSFTSFAVIEQTAFYDRMRQKGRTTDATAITANTTLAADGQAVLAVEANKTYDVIIRPRFNSPTTPGIKIGLSVPSGAAALGSASMSANGVTMTDLVSTGISFTGAASDKQGYIYGRLVVGGTAGNVAIAVAQNTSDAGSTVLLAGSMLILTEA